MAEREKRVWKIRKLPPSDARLNPVCDIEGRYQEEPIYVVPASHADSLERQVERLEQALREFMEATNDKSWRRYAAARKQAREALGAEHV